MKTKGNWVIKTSAGGYWCGKAHFDPQLRKAQVYHWKEAAEDQIETIKRRKYMPAELEYEVVAISEPKELKDAEAEWLITYLDGEKNFVCSHCGYLALYDISEQTFDSHFCPHCGRSMVNSTEPWTERCK